MLCRHGPGASARVPGGAGRPPTALGAVLDGPGSSTRPTVARRGAAPSAAATSPRPGRARRATSMLPCCGSATSTPVSVSPPSVRPRYPAPLADDIEPPAMLFLRGDPSVIAGPRVAIVGTRQCTRYGLDVAFDFGCELAAAGVAVVSGLALGIDGAAHAGALCVGQPADRRGRQRPRRDLPDARHAVLWREVERRGVVLSPRRRSARPPERWRFPARNRLIAALADIVVVGESRGRGGSMHTVTEADAARSRRCSPYPGRCAARRRPGTNRALSRRAPAACDVSDVLVGLGLSAALQRDGPRPPPRVSGHDGWCSTRSPGSRRRSSSLPPEPEWSSAPSHSRCCA